MIITRFTQLLQEYHHLAAGDAFIGQIPAGRLKSAWLIDLVGRGVRLLPSATAQLLNGSKAAQAALLQPFMLPHTRVIQHRKELLAAVGDYARAQMASAVTKEDRLHCGHGVRKWESLETLYSCLSLDKGQYPFVLQPFVAEFVDIRVIIVGDYCEAYRRNNPDNFRMNLAAGGQSRPHELSAAQVDFCRRVMQRAQMPYAHMDLMLTGTGQTYLSEISLNAGAHAARIARAELERLKQERLRALAAQPSG